MRLVKFGFDVFVLSLRFQTFRLISLQNSIENSVAGTRLLLTEDAQATFEITDIELLPLLPKNWSTCRNLQPLFAGQHKTFKFRSRARSQVKAQTFLTTK